MPVSYNTWILFRIVVDIVLANDLAACTFRYGCPLAHRIADALHNRRRNVW